MIINQVVDQYVAQPKKLFVIDGLGAVVSMFLLGIVLVQMEWFFGIPATALYILAALPVFFALYDIYCYKFVKRNIGGYLKGIAIINILYCCLSLGFAFYHLDSVTIMGWIYIIIEIIIVLIIAIIELKVANKIVISRM